MLHNILLKVGEHTEITKQGKFINVVLAAGEITARIRMTNDQTFETKLVSGMAFPVPQGYQSVAFSSDVNQQTKVWLGDLPLTYSPTNSKIVGSTSVQSYTAQSYYNQLTELLPARVGRNKTLLQASEDFYIAGVGGDIDKAIKVPANELFPISTQGVLYSYSPNPFDVLTQYSALTLPMNLTQSSDLGSAIEGAFYNDLTNEYCIIQGGRVWVSSAITMSNPVELASLASYDVHHQNIIHQADSFILFAEYGSDLYKITVAKDDYTVSEAVIIHDLPSASFNSIHVASDKVITQSSESGGDTYVLALDGSEQTLIAKTGLSANFSGANRAFFLANHEVLLISGAYDAWAVTDDNGASWTEGLFTFDIKGSQSNTVVDSVTGAIYAVGQFDPVIYKSIDKGRSWQELTETPDGISSTGAGSISVLHAFNSHLYATTHDTFYYFNGETWGEVELPSGVGTVKAINSCSNGLITISTASGFLLTVSGEVAFSGGLKINILEENN